MNLARGMILSYDEIPEECTAYVVCGVMRGYARIVFKHADGRIYAWTVGLPHALRRTIIDSDGVKCGRLARNDAM